MKKADQNVKNKVCELVRRQKWLHSELAQLDHQITATFMGPPNQHPRKPGDLFDATFAPQCYSGTYQVYTDYGVQLASLHGPSTLRLIAGGYLVFVAGGNFAFEMSSKGALTIARGLPAKVKKRNHLVFKNSKITIDPRDYDGAYYVAGHYGIPLRGRQTVVIVPGLPSFVDVYGTYTGTDINFKTNPRGKIDATSLSPVGAATLKNGVLTFQTTSICIDPGSFKGGYILAGHYCESQPGKWSFALVKNLSCYIEFYGCGTNHEVVFKVEADGSIKPASVSNPLAVSVQAGPPVTLNINSRTVKIDTYFDGRFRVGNNYFGSASPQAQTPYTYSFVMVKNFATFIEIVDGKSADITPSDHTVDPPSVSVPDEKNLPQTFTFPYV